MRSGEFSHSPRGFSDEAFPESELDGCSMLGMILLALRLSSLILPQVAIPRVRASIDVVLKRLNPRSHSYV